MPFTVELASDDTNVRPLGSRSVTFTFEAVAGPAFFAVKVYVTVSPIFGAVLSTDLVTDTSEEEAASVLVMVQVDVAPEVTNILEHPLYVGV